MSPALIVLNQYLPKPLMTGILRAGVSVMPRKLNLVGEVAVLCPGLALEDSQVLWANLFQGSQAVALPESGLSGFQGCF